jgi:U4/U6 small nuclear ribonucleoprotein PRP3
LSKKLTKEEKADKLTRRLKRDSAVECKVALFKVEDLSFGGHRFKIDKNS